MTPAELEVLQAARVLATRHQPYLAVALHSLVLRPAPGLGTFAVDPAWRLYVDPAVLSLWSVEQVGAVLVHEVWHLLRDHAGRGGRVGVAGRERAWNTACDAEINDDLLEAGLPLPGTPPTPERLRMPDGLLAEEYFAELPATPSTRWVVDCGSGVDGVPRPWDDDSAAGLTAVQADLVRAATARAVEDAARTGSVPGGWERWAALHLRPLVDWRTVLAAGVRSGLGWVAGSVDHTRSRPSRRGAATPGVVLSSLRRPVPTVAVVVDTSGSVDDERLAQALAEVDGALAGVRRGSVTVLSCDAQAGPAQRVRSAAQVRLAGGGGTDLRVGIDAAAALRPRPQLVVVLTDGRTPWPAAPPPGVRVVVALLERTDVAPPSWASVVRAF